MDPIHEFYSISTCNDWNHETHYIGPKIVSDQGTVSTRDQDQKRRVKDGDQLEVLLPDGSREFGRVKVREVPTSYGDMGQQCQTTTEVLTISGRPGFNFVPDAVKVRFANEQARVICMVNVAAAVARQKRQEHERHLADIEQLRKRITETRDELKRLQERLAADEERLRLLES